MYGAILGDMIGAPYEFDRGSKTKDFPLFSEQSKFTDDTVMTIAVADALLGAAGKGDGTVRELLVRCMQKWGKKYPHAGYGARFSSWLYEEEPKPYRSYGNGSAMRVSAAGWLYETLEETRRIARLTAEVTHNHPEGIKGAEATASVIFLARTGSEKDEIREYVEKEFGYDLSRTCDEIRPSYYHVESCQETVPEAITAFLEGNGFEDTIRTAVSLGGDCDTLTCIAGSMAEAYDGIPSKLIDECRSRLSKEILAVIDRFEPLREKRGAHYMKLGGDYIIRNGKQVPAIIEHGFFSHSYENQIKQEKITLEDAQRIAEKVDPEADRVEEFPKGWHFMRSEDESSLNDPGFAVSRKDGHIYYGYAAHEFLNESEDE